MYAQEIVSVQEALSALSLMGQAPSKPQLYNSVGSQEKALKKVFSLAIGDKNVFKRHVLSRIHYLM